MHIKNSSQVVRDKWPDLIEVSDIDNNGFGQSVYLQISADRKSIEMDIYRREFQFTAHNTVTIDKEKATKIVNYLRNHYRI